MEVMAKDHAPIGHMTEVHRRARCPKDNTCWRGRGFGDLAGPTSARGRIHHCMRSIASRTGAGNDVKRAGTRTASDRKIAKLGQDLEVISRARTRSTRCGWPVLGRPPRHGRAWQQGSADHVSACEAIVPQKVCLHHRQAMQMHGAAGMSQCFPGRHVCRHAPPRYAMARTKCTTWWSARAEVQKHALVGRRLLGRAALRWDDGDGERIGRRGGRSHSVMRNGPDLRSCGPALRPWARGVGRSRSFTGGGHLIGVDLEADGRRSSVDRARDLAAIERPFGQAPPRPAMQRRGLAACDWSRHAARSGVVRAMRPADAETPPIVPVGQR